MDMTDVNPAFYINPIILLILVVPFRESILSVTRSSTSSALAPANFLLAFRLTSVIQKLQQYFSSAERDCCATFLS